MDNLKDQFFNDQFYETLASDLKNVFTELDKEKFKKEARENKAQHELMQRLTQTTKALSTHLPRDFDQAIAILKRLPTKIKSGFSGLVFTEFISRNGLDHFEYSMDAIEYFTQFSTAEFAVRHFLVRDFEKTLNHVTTNEKHSGERVERVFSGTLDATHQIPGLAKQRVSFIFAFVRIFALAFR